MQQTPFNFRTTIKKAETPTLPQPKCPSTVAGTPLLLYVDLGTDEPGMTLPRRDRSHDWKEYLVAASIF